MKMVAFSSECKIHEGKMSAERRRCRIIRVDTRSSSVRTNDISRKCSPVQWFHFFITMQRSKGLRPLAKRLIFSILIFALEIILIHVSKNILWRSVLVQRGLHGQCHISYFLFITHHNISLYYVFQKRPVNCSLNLEII